MRILWCEEAWDEYQYCQEREKRSYKRINKLIKDIERNGVNIGIGKPELLKYDFKGYWSREIDEKNRLIYKLTDRGELEIRKCQDHYNDH